MMKKTSTTVLIGCVVILSACQSPPIDLIRAEILLLDAEHQKQPYAVSASVGHIIKSKVTSQKKIVVKYDQHLLVRGFIAALQGQSQLDKIEVQSITREVEIRDVKRRKR